MASQNPNYDVVVVGAGPGGYAAAFTAADLGFRVALVERDRRLGGVCLLRGCVPSKALIAAAALLERLQQIAPMGLGVQPPVTLDLPRLQQWKQTIVERMARGLQELVRARRIERLEGEARCSATLGELVLSDGTGAVRRVRGRYVILATGSEPLVPPGLAVDGEVVVTSDQVLELQRVPQRALVVGGSYIGLELGRCLRAFGAEVSVVEMLPRLLPGFDEDLVRPVQRQLQRVGITVRTKTRVERIERRGAEAAVWFQGEAEPELFDLVLIATGRRAATASLELNRWGVTVDETGAIVTNARGQTARRNVFAIGDCRGGAMLAHKARHEGIELARWIAGRAERGARYVPAVVFTDPEVACVGLTEEQATRWGLVPGEVRVERFPLAAVARTALLGATGGWVKMLIDRSTRCVLGVGIVGPEAGELIAEAALAVQAGVRADELARVIHPHPTLAESLEEVASLLTGSTVHLYKPPR